MCILCAIGPIKIIMDILKLIQEMEQDQNIKSKVSKMMMLLHEVRKLTESEENANPSIQSSIDFISISLIDLKYKIHDQKKSHRKNM